MFVQQLFESNAKRVVVIYPGRFQPFHLGHKEVFESLQAKFGSENVFIGTSNKVALPKSPFNFSEKLQLMNAAGINSHHVLEIAEPYKPGEYIQALNFDPTQTVMIFAVGEPDLARLEVDGYYTEKTPTGRPSKIPPGKQVGDPKPLKSFQDLNQCVTADQHQYVLIAKERPKNVSVNGQKFDASHGTQVRELWNQVRNDPDASAQFMQQLYGKPSAELAHVLNNIPEATTVPAPAPKPSPKLSPVKQPKPTAQEPVSENLADEFAAMAKARYPTATIRTNGQTVQEPPRRETPVTKPEPLSPEKRQELEQQLADLERVFDRDYEYSDDHRVWTKHRDIAARIGNIKRMLATESQIAIGDIVTVTAGPMTNLSGIVESFGHAGKFVVVDIHGQDKISVPVAFVALQEADDHTKHLHLHYKKNRFKTLKKARELPEDDVEESLYQYDKADPYNSEFAPDVGMGRMTLRGWKQSMIRRVKEFAQQLERSGQDLDRDALWDHVHKKLQSMNLDPIAQEIELAHQELENIRKRGGIRSRAFKK
jgi:cytidyltransferase-like protein